MKILCFEIKYIGWILNKVSEAEIKKAKAEIKKAVLEEWYKTSSKISAVKKYHQLTGVSLKDAKKYCDKLRGKK